MHTHFNRHGETEIDYLIEVTYKIESLTETAITAQCTHRHEVK